MDFDGWLASAPVRGRRATRLACVSAALELGLEVLHPPAELHLWAPPSGNVVRQPGVVWHRSKAIGRHSGPRSESVLDVLVHVADCLPHVEALVVWESAIRRRRVSLGGLHRVRWPHLRARGLVREATGLSDSLVETIAVDGLRHAGIALRQQVEGHSVLRFTYEHVVARFEHVLRTVERAMEQGLHLAAG